VVGGLLLTIRSKFGITRDGVAASITPSNATRAGLA
jgi:hypothetical protein